MPPPLAAKPTRSIFDPFNSSSTGHQRAENRLGHSTSWRASRALKLRNQFTSDRGGGKRISDTVGAGSENFGLDGRTENGGFVPGAQGLRTGGQRSIWESMKVEKVRDEDGERAAKRVKVETASPKKTVVVNPFTPFRRADGGVRESSWPSVHSHEAQAPVAAPAIATGTKAAPSSPSDLLSPLFTPPSSSNAHPSPATKSEPSEPPADLDELSSTPPPQIFTNLTFYINGSTAPYSDHQIKQLLSKHGGGLSCSLARRTVTHVVLGQPNSKGGSSGGAGAGGGVASSKIQKEVGGTNRGAKVRYVGAAWIVESVKAGRRLPEARFEGSRMAPKGVGRIEGLFGVGKGVVKS